MVTQNGVKIQTAQDLIDREFGLKTEVRLSRLVSQIETTVTQILLPNPGRIAFTITVLGANFAYVLNDPGVSATRGERINASGGQGASIYSEDFTRVTHGLWGIADTGATAITILEVLIAS